DRREVHAAVGALLAEDVVPVGGVQRLPRLEVLDVGHVAQLVGPLAAALGDAVLAVALRGDHLRLLAAGRRLGRRGLPLGPAALGGGRLRSALALVLA